MDIENYNGFIDINDMKWHLEMEYASKCYGKEKAAKKIGVDFDCKCPNPYEWDDSKIEKEFDKMFGTNDYIRNEKAYDYMERLHKL